MSDGREKLHQFFLGRGVPTEQADGTMQNLEALFQAADSRIIQLTPQGEVDKIGILKLVKDVLHDDTSGETCGFTVKMVQAVPVDKVQCLRSKSVGMMRPTDWPPAGISSFGISALLFLRYSADMRDDVFGAVHEIAYRTLLDELRHVALPDGGLLGGAWIVPWTIVADSVFFYITHTVMGLPAAEQLGQFVRHLPGVLPMGFRIRDSQIVSREMVVICG